MYLPTYLFMGTLNLCNSIKNNRPIVVNLFPPCLQPIFFQKIIILKFAVQSESLVNHFENKLTPIRKANSQSENIYLTSLFTFWWICIFRFPKNFERIVIVAINALKQRKIRFVTGINSIKIDILVNCAFKSENIQFI